MMKLSKLKSFVPKDNVSLNLGKTTIYVYPHVSEEMSLGRRDMDPPDRWPAGRKSDTTIEKQEPVHDVIKRRYPFM
jgi:hypothetical protein